MKKMNIALNHTLTTLRNCFEFNFELILRKRLIINGNKFDWETLNTAKIKIVFYSVFWTVGDYGTKLRIKCHQQIKRNEKTIGGELCMNWELIESFGVLLDFNETIDYNDDYKKFYDDLYYSPYYSYYFWRWSGYGLC